MKKVLSSHFIKKQPILLEYKPTGVVYLLEPEVLSWLDDNPGITDFSTEVLPYFIEKIATWKNKGIHRDIGTL